MKMLTVVGEMMDIDWKPLADETTSKLDLRDFNI